MHTDELRIHMMIIAVIDVTGTPPIAVLYKDIKDTGDFNPMHEKVYKYEVLGGLHGVTARQELIL